MKVEYINPFIVSTKDAFGTMLDCEVSRSNLHAMRNFQPAFEVTGVIGLTGKAVGSVALSVSRNLAIKAAETMLLEDVNELNDDVIDTVGELANMVAGGAKAQLEKYDMSISLPTVIVGKAKVIEFPSDANVICIGFDSDWGDLAVQVALLEVDSED